MARAVVAASLALAAAAVVVARAPAVAWAQAGQSGVVIYAEGKDAAGVRDDVRKALPAGASLRDESAFVKALAAQGVKTPLGARMQSARARKALAKKVQKAAAAAGVQTVILASANARGAPRVTLLIVNAGSDRPVADRTVTGATAGKGKRRPEVVAAVVVPALSGGATREPGAPPEGGPAAPERPAPAGGETSVGGQALPGAEASAGGQASTGGEAAGGRASAGGGTAPDRGAGAKAGAAPDDASEGGPDGFSAGLLTASIGVGAEGRYVSYKDRVTTNLRPYELFAAPHAFARLELYPLATTGVAVLRDVGLVGSYGRGFGISSTVPGGGKVGSTFDDYAVGARYRLRLSRATRPPLLGLEATYTRWRFTFDQGGGLNRDEPSVAYQAARVGVDGRVPFGAPALLFGAGYRFVSDAGPLGDRFPNGSAGGLDWHLGLGLRLGRRVEGRVSLDYARYFHSFDPAPGDAYVAGGALDQFYGLHVGAAVAP